MARAAEVSFAVRVGVRRVSPRSVLLYSELPTHLRGGDSSALRAANPPRDRIPLSPKGDRAQVALSTPAICPQLLQPVGPAAAPATPPRDYGRDIRPATRHRTWVRQAMAQPAYGGAEHDVRRSAQSPRSNAGGICGVGWPLYCPFRLVPEHPLDSTRRWAPGGWTVAAYRELRISQQLGYVGRRCCLHRGTDARYSCAARRRRLDSCGVGWLKSLSTLCGSDVRG